MGNGGNGKNCQGVKTPFVFSHRVLKKLFKNCSSSYKKSSKIILNRNYKALLHCIALQSVIGMCTIQNHFKRPNGNVGLASSQNMGGFEYGVGYVAVGMQSG